MISQFEIYGKTPLWKKFYLDIKERFIINKYSKRICNSLGVKPYVPKLNKKRVFVGIFGVIICIAIPFITPLAIFPLKWGLK